MSDTEAEMKKYCSFSLKTNVDGKQVANFFFHLQYFMVHIEVKENV